jgi:hypothetical protein
LSLPALGNVLDVDGPLAADLSGDRFPLLDLFFDPGAVLQQARVIGTHSVVEHATDRLGKVEVSTLVLQALGAEDECRAGCLTCWLRYVLAGDLPKRRESELGEDVDEQEVVAGEAVTAVEEVEEHMEVGARVRNNLSRARFGALGLLIFLRRLVCKMLEEKDENVMILHTRRLVSNTICRKGFQRSEDSISGWQQKDTGLGATHCMSRWIGKMTLLAVNGSGSSLNQAKSLRRNSYACSIDSLDPSRNTSCAIRVVIIRNSMFARYVSP